MPQPPSYTRALTAHLLPLMQPQVQLLQLLLLPLQLRSLLLQLLLLLLQGSSLLLQLLLTHSQLGLLRFQRAAAGLQLTLATLQPRLPICSSSSSSTFGVQSMPVKALTRALQQDSRHVDWQMPGTGSWKVSV